jgi:hypothetical protein
MEMGRPVMERIPMEKVMIPSPPIWISIRIIICPGTVKASPVVTTVNPVTQTADVDVKRASIKDKSPECITGIISKSDPAQMAPVKAPRIIQMGCIRIIRMHSKNGVDNYAVTRYPINSYPMNSGMSTC